MYLLGKKVKPVEYCREENPFKKTVVHYQGLLLLEIQNKIICLLVKR